MLQLLGVRQNLRLYLFITVLIPNFLSAKVNDPLGLYKCTDRLRNIGMEWKSEDQWRSEPLPIGGLMHSTNTSSFGVWIQVYNESPNQINIEKTDSEATLRFKVLTKNCKTDIEIISRIKEQTLEPLGTDKTLQKEIEDKKNGIILSWSPSMPFSVQAIEEAKAFSQKSKVHLIVLLDRNANLDSALKIVKKKKWPETYSKKFDSIELAYRKIENHFPSALFFKDGKIANYLIPGLKVAKGYQKEFEAIK